MRCSDGAGLFTAEGPLRLPPNENNPAEGEDAMRINRFKLILLAVALAGAGACSRNAPADNAENAEQASVARNPAMAPLTVQRPMF